MQPTASIRQPEPAEGIALGILAGAETEHPYLTLYIRELLADPTFRERFGNWQPTGVVWDYEHAAGYVLANAPGRSLAELIHHDGNHRTPQAYPADTSLLRRALDAAVLPLVLAVSAYRRRLYPDGDNTAANRANLTEAIFTYAADLLREYHALGARLQQGDAL